MTHIKKGSLYRILFVCLGNICRSPAAHGIMEHYVKQKGVWDRFEIDSAGTYGGHAGELPDARMRQHASKRGYRLTHRSRPVKRADFDSFDMILAMDDANYDTLNRLAPDMESARKIVRMVDYCTTFSDDHIPDPYYGGAAGFEHVLDLLEEACGNLLCRLAEVDK